MITDVLKRASPALALAAIYFIAGRFGLSLATLHPSASAVWPPSGIAFAALLLWGYRLWPGVLLGAFFVNLINAGPTTALFIGLGNTLEALLGAWLINTFANGAKVFERARNIFKFVLLAALLSTIVSATIGVTTLSIGGLARWEDYTAILLTWWLGDVTGDLLVAPLIVIWSTQRIPILKPRRIPHVVELAGLLTALAALGHFIFLVQPRPAVEYLATIPLLWAAFRFGPHGAVTTALITFAIALAGTLEETGPFAGDNVHRSLLYLQGFTGTISVTALILAAVITEQRRAERRLEIQEAVSRLLADSPDLRQAGSKLLQTICERADWSIGALWLLDEAGKELSCVEYWNSPGTSAPLFKADTMQRKFVPGSGLPGRVLLTGEPAWVSDLREDGNFPRSAIAAQEKLRSGFVFPLVIGNRVVGALECFSCEVRELDDDLLRMARDIGSQLGGFIERKKSEELLAKTRLDLIASNEQLEQRVQERTAELKLAHTAILKNFEDQKQLEEQLRHAHKMESIGTLAGGIAHDVNNTLNIIKGYADLIAAQHATDPETVENIEVIQAEIKNSAAVVRRLLTLARKTETRLERVAANTIATVVSGLIKQTFPKNIEIMLRLQQPLPPTLADLNEMNQVLLNLCLNARDSMPEGGELIISTELIESDRIPRRPPELTEGRYICIAVTDTGIGMDENIRARAFEPFFTTKGVKEGTGLGLAMAYSVIKNHKGFIDLESEIGKGTTVQLYLPVAEPEDDTERREIPEIKSVEGRPSASTATVFIVEDETRMLRLLQNALIQAGHRVIVATDGAQALDLSRQHGGEFDVIVMDIGLPKITGGEVIRKIKEQNPEARIVVTTGYLEPALQSELLGFGVKDYIQKPYSVDVVVRTIHSVLSRD
jgi:signal transduction histidine kinase/integral membrane sensor domain MASE1